MFPRRPELGGICQYHSDILPGKALQIGLLAHPSVFVNETLSRINPHYVSPDVFNHKATQNPDLEIFLNRLVQQQGMD